MAPGLVAFVGTGLRRLRSPESSVLPFALVAVFGSVVLSAALSMGEPRYRIPFDGVLIVLAAILQRVDLLLTGDTGPLHVAGAVGTPVVAVFGPSDPTRYGPTGPLDRVVRVDLPCSPCNRIRRPPERCVGHTPDCLALVATDRVYRAVTAVLDDSRRRPARAGHATA